MTGNARHTSVHRAANTIFLRPVFFIHLTQRSSSHVLMKVSVDRHLLRKYILNLLKDVAPAILDDDRK